ncbi:hypothetical protein [Salidesulfovibrio onnuriiensis]|uniref:hypothetical protein n=1 Tax=Salidesulfovibrio onnuriiensis TaxID=2583823 RepID=UPI0011CBC8B3|nr:hypothetical protein [Salidesulfovibrio onnuriiensis]
MLAADGAQASQFLFFARHYNDIDHVVPVIWGLLRKGVEPSRIRYIAYEADPSIEPRRDKRLQFLARQGVVLEAPYLYGGFRSVLHWLSAAPLGKLVRRKARKFLYRKLVDRTAPMEHAVQVISRAPEGSVFITDHNQSSNALALIEEAKKKGFPTVSLPHGFQFHYGHADPEGQEIILSSVTARPLVSCFDHVVVNDEWQRELADADVDNPGRLHVFGLPRFDPEWVRELCNMYPAPASKTGRLKVLVILEKGDMSVNGRFVEWINAEEQFRAIDFLAKHPCVELKIKGNARGVSHRQSKMLRAYKRYLAEDAIPTNQLISWADLSVGCCSSVFMDAFVRNKPVILLEYATSVKMALRGFGFDANPGSYEDFTVMVNKLVERRAENLYDEKSLQQMIKYYVYGGSSGRSVVDTYADFLQSLIN